MKLAASAFLLLALAGCGARTDLEPPGSESGPSEPEVCNGRDDDLDGLVDEGLGERTCGLGACRVAVPACVDGVSQTCAPKPSSTEVCNGRDDDCDGTVDGALALHLRSGPHLVDSQLTYVAYGMIMPATQGFVVAYGTGFNGTAPTPNALFARLGPNGAPLAAPVAFTDRNMPNGLRLAPSGSDWLAAYCGRFGTEDQAATGLLRADGSFTEFGLRPPTHNHCGAGTPDGGATPEGFLYGFVDNSNYGVWLDVSGFDGASVESRRLHERGDFRSMPRFATLGAVTLLTYSIFDGTRSRLRLHRLASDGTDREPPFELDLPNQPAGFKDAQVAAGGASFLLLAHDEAGSAFRVRFDDEGNVVDGPTLEPELTGITQLAFAADAAGGYIATGTIDERAFAARLSEAGAITTLWTSDDAPALAGRAFAFPMVAAGGGSVVFGYAELNAGARLEVIELGCAP